MSRLARRPSTPVPRRSSPPLRLPAGVQQRLTELLDKQDTGTTLTDAERHEADGLVDLAELLSLLRLRSERMSSRSGSPKIAKKAVDGLSRSLQSRSKLVESPFPPRNQTWKQTFWTGTRKSNSYPLKVKARIS